MQRRENACYRASTQSKGLLSREAFVGRSGAASVLARCRFLLAILLTDVFPSSESELRRRVGMLRASFSKVRVCVSQPLCNNPEAWLSRLCLEDKNEYIYFSAVHTLEPGEVRELFIDLRILQLPSSFASEVLF